MEQGQEIKLKGSDIIANIKEGKKMSLLFLDDSRDPFTCATYMYRRDVDCRIYHEQWNVVRSYGQFKALIETNGLPDFISFDYDLDDVPELKESLPLAEWFDVDKNEAYTGADCLAWLMDYCSSEKKPLPQFAIHSSNPDGANVMDNLFSLRMAKAIEIGAGFTPNFEYKPKDDANTYNAYKPKNKEHAFCFQFFDDIKLLNSLALLQCEDNQAFVKQLQVLKQHIQSYEETNTTQKWI